MSETAVETPKATSRNGSSNKTITITVDDLDRLLKERVAAAVEDLKGAMPPSAVKTGGENSWIQQFVGTPTPGQRVPLGTIPPEGWQTVVMRDGTETIWPKPEGFNPLERYDTLKKIDAAWDEWMTPTADDKKPAQPTYLYVNDYFAKLFPSQMTRPWGDNTAMVRVADNAPELKGAQAIGKVRFRFARQEE